MSTRKNSKLNLINKIRSKKRSKEPSERVVWFIAKKEQGVNFYLADFDEDNNAALWCRSSDQAIPFLTEQGVYQYISAYLNNRTDIYLVCLTSK